MASEKVIAFPLILHDVLTPFLAEPPVCQLSFPNMYHQSLLSKFKKWPVKKRLSASHGFSSILHDVRTPSSAQPPVCHRAGLPAE